MPLRGEEARNQAAFWKYPHFFELSDQFLFQCEKPLSARSRRLPSSTPLPKSTDWILSAVAATLCAFLAAAAKIAAIFSKSIHGRLVAVNRPKKLLQLGRRRLQRCELANEFAHRPSLPVADVLMQMY
jgi:hypothetical protein